MYFNDPITFYLLGPNYIFLFEHRPNYFKNMKNDYLDFQVTLALIRLWIIHLGGCSIDAYGICHPQSFMLNVFNMKWTKFIPTLGI